MYLDFIEQQQKLNVIMYLDFIEQQQKLKVINVLKLYRTTTTTYLMV